MLLPWLTPPPQLHCHHPPKFHIFAFLPLQCLLSSLTPVTIHFPCPECTLTSLTSALLQRLLGHWDLTFSFIHGNVFGFEVTWYSAHSNSRVRSKITCKIKTTAPTSTEPLTDALLKVFSAPLEDVGLVTLNVCVSVQNFLTSSASLKFPQLMSFWPWP